MLLIDSAGVQSTVSYRKQAVDAIHDAMTTESLVFKVISRSRVSVSKAWMCRDAVILLLLPCCCHNFNQQMVKGLTACGFIRFRISHQMIFVVNDLTWFEQKYLEMLHQNYVQCKKQKAPGTREHHFDIF